VTDRSSGSRAAVRRLDLCYGQAYLIFSGDGVYSATRRDNGQVLTAASPDDLRDKIEADVTASPVPTWAFNELPP
jgi:hypothetical protein